MRVVVVLLSLSLVSLTQAAELSVHLGCGADLAIDGTVDTLTDTFHIVSWTASPALRCRVPAADQFPLVLQAFTASGSRYNVPDTWKGAIGETAGWAFLLPVGQDLTTVQWVEGQPTDFWKKASFGWGGLRNSLGEVVLKRSDWLCYMPRVNTDVVVELKMSEVRVASVPEPGSFMFLIVGSAALACGRRGSAMVASSREKA